MTCDGCAVWEPWEHRCHGEPCPCEECREERRLFGDVNDGIWARIPSDGHLRHVDNDCTSVGFSGEGRCIEPATQGGLCLMHAASAGISTTPGEASG